MRQRSSTRSWYLIIQKILIPEYFQNTERFDHDDFWRCETKELDKIVITLLSNKFLMPEHFWDTTVPPPNFWYCETKKIDKIVLPLIHKKNSKPEQFRNTEWFAHVVFRRRETKIFRRKNVTPLYHPLSFPTRNFLKHRRVPPRCFSVTWDKKFQTVKRDTHLLIPSFFPY